MVAARGFKMVVDAVEEEEAVERGRGLFEFNKIRRPEGNRHFESTFPTDPK